MCMIQSTDNTMIQSCLLHAVSLLFFVCKRFHTCLATDNSSCCHGFHRKMFKMTGATVISTAATTSLARFSYVHCMAIIASRIPKISRHLIPSRVKLHTKEHFSHTFISIFIFSFRSRNTTTRHLIRINYLVQK